SGPERVAVDAVLTDEQGNPQAGLLQKLVRLEDVVARGVQQGSGVAREHRVRAVDARIELQHLTDLLLDRHAGQKVGDAFGGREGGVAERHHFLLLSGVETERTAVTVLLTFRPFLRMARARSPAERRRGLTYSSIPKLMS